MRPTKTRGRALKRRRVSPKDDEDDASVKAEEVASAEEGKC